MIVLNEESNDLADTLTGKEVAKRVRADTEVLEQVQERCTARCLVFMVVLTVASVALLVIAQLLGAE